MTRLEEIAAHTRAVVEANKKVTPQSDLETLCYSVPAPRDFQAAIERAQPIGLIAETKKASPSAGLLRAEYDPAALAKSYEAAGAKAISVLTEGKYFLGHADHLRTVKESSRLPVLRKDFVIDEYQIYESTAMGADAVLLIARLFDAETLEEFVALTHELSIAALVEVHDLADLERAQKADARLIGINNRDLANFQVSLKTTFDLAPRVDSHRVVISESGIASSEDVRALIAAGVRGILVGEAIVRAEDPAAKIRELLS